MANRQAAGPVRCAERLAEYECGRCGRRRRFFDLWPDGYICKPCYIGATRINGTCAGCGEQRLLPGRGPGRSAICRDCAGIPRAFDCRRCGAEGQLFYRKVCVRCRLDDLARERLDDGTGTVRPDLQPLVAVLAGRYKTPPESRLAWLNLGRTKQLLTALATSHLALDHAALDAYPDHRSIPYLRALLVAARRRRLPARARPRPAQLRNLADQPPRRTRRAPLRAGLAAVRQLVSTAEDAR